jgi:anthranilate synthase component 1
MYYPTLEEATRRRGEGNLIPVYREIVADLETPVSAFMKVGGEGHSFLLESVEGGQRLARYSFIGANPYHVLTTWPQDQRDPLPLISSMLSGHKLIPVEGLPRFCGGAVGYLSYECVTRFEELPTPARDSLDLPEALFMFFDSLLVFDHVTHRIKVVSHVHLKDNIEAAYREAVERIDSLVEKLGKPLPTRPDNSWALASGHQYTSNFTRPAFEAAVAKVRDYITAGEAIQVVLSQRLSQVTKVAPFEIYRALRTINPSPYMFYLDCGGFQIVGASPEMLVRVEEGTVMTRPLAGTRRRGQNHEEDLALEAELRADEKERAEHIMLVDLARNDIGAVAEPGSVEVSDLMDVERFSHVMHLVTHVQGRLRQGLTAFDALRACFPAGTVSGAPKVRSMQLIAELEPEKRGPYAGAAGYFSFSGNMDMAISIRTLVLKDGVAVVQAGCGIVYDSDPAREYEETLNKAQALLKAINQAENPESLARRKNAPANR